jgi:uncharacterized integral membrane protein
MNNLWLKVKIWTKGLLFGAVILYALLFLYNNSGRDPVKFWYWFNKEPNASPLLLVFLAFVAGVIATILVRTTFTTVRQIRDVRNQSRLERLEREHAEMRAKAAMLQTKATPENPNDAG